MNLTTFNFNNLSIRSMSDSQGNPWFVAADVCEILEIGNVSQAMTRLDEEEKSDIITNDTSSNGVTQKRNMTIINESGLYSLILTSRKPEAKSFKKWITSEVLPTIRKTGQYSVQPSKIPFNEAAAGLEIIYRSLNVSESSKLGLFRGLAEDYGLSTKRLPDYTVDAPTITAGSSVPTISITEVIKRSGLKMSAMAANSRLESLGLIKQEYRPSTRGNGIKKYWTITSKGLEYGKNLTSDKNPRETTVHWYTTSVESLSKMMG